MLVWIGLFITLGVLALFLALGYFLVYFYFYPEKRPENVIQSTADKIKKCEDGAAGAAGADGKLEEFALVGVNGPGGIVGPAGKSGQKNLNAGRRGRKGLRGLTGPPGTGGGLGEKGIPSNSLVPYVNRSPSNDFDVSPEIFTHSFSYDGTSYNLTSSFLFEEIGYFSFLNGAKNKRFKIKTIFKVFSGNTDPTTEGGNGDFYINTTNNTLFGPKAGGSWPVSGTSLGGPPFATNVFNETIDPTTEGVDGDFYFNNVSNTLFGPKAGGSWPTPGMVLVEPENDLGFKPITDGEGKKIYSTIRIILERKDSSSDGIIFYESPPIVKDAFLISSTKNLNYSIAGNNLQELLIDQNRDFGLDFEIEADTTPYYNFIVGGLARYRAIVNIDPFNSDIVPRIEERFSNKPITEFASHTIKVKAKSNIIRIKAPKNPNDGNTDAMAMVPTAPVVTDIYILSPRLQMGRVIFKDASNAKSVYKIDDATRLADTINPEDPPILQAIEVLGEEANSFSGKANNYNRIVAIESYSAGVQDNLLVGFKGNPPDNSAAIFDLNEAKGIYDTTFNNFSTAETALKTAVDNSTFPNPILDDPVVVDLLTNIGSATSYVFTFTSFLAEAFALQQEIDSFNANGQTNMDAFFTRTTLKNLQLDYPIDKSPLTYPSDLEGSYLIIKFILKVSRKNFTNFKYFIYNTNIDNTPIATVESSKSVIYRTRVFTNYLGSSESLKTDLPIVFEEQYLYSEISLGETTNENLFFENFYGRTIILKFSEAIADLQLRYRGDNMSDTFDTQPSVRLATQTVSKTVFEGSNDDYGFTNIGGWDAECQVKELEVELDNFVVGYFKDGPGSNPMGQRVKGTRRSNGDYLLTIPLSGYNNII